MNIFKTDIGIKSENFIIKIIIATVIAVGTLITMYNLFKI